MIMNLIIKSSFIFFMLITLNTFSQIEVTSMVVLENGDTINRIDKNGYRQGIWKKLKKNKIISDAFFVNDTLNGFVNWYYNNGNLSEKYKFIYNNLIDTSYSYYRSGKLSSIKIYSEGEIIKEIRYYKNQQIYSIANFENGKFYGYDKLYYKNGNLKKENIYSISTKKVIFYKRNGNIKRQLLLSQ